MHSIKINRMLPTRKHYYVTKSVFVKKKLLQMTDFWSATVKDAGMGSFSTFTYLVRMANKSKSTWQCPACRKSKFQPTTCISLNSESESENEVKFVKKTVGSISKTSVFANLTSTDFDIINDPNGWLDCSIIQQAQVLLQQHNPLIDGLQ